MSLTNISAQIPNPLDVLQFNLNSSFCNEKLVITKFLSENPLYLFDFFAYVIILTICGFILLMRFRIADFSMRFIDKKYYKTIVEELEIIPVTLISGLSFALLFLMVFS